MKILAYLLVINLTVSSAFAQTIFPARTPSDIVKSITIYSSLDEDFSKPLIIAFQKNNPTIEVHYNDLQSLDIYERIIKETDEDKKTADLVISSAMDLQVKLANDGYAQTFQGANSSWPFWAKWQNSAFGLTFEPSVIVYHKPSFKDIKTPENRSELEDLLTTSNDEFFGRIGTYDIEQSGLGFLFLARDKEHDRDLWALINAMGSSGIKLYSNSSSILERISDGRLAIGYNILGSYAQSWADRNPDIGIILPEDYTVVMSRIALIPSAAEQPDLGKEFLSFLMSHDGQNTMAQELKLPALHPDIKGENTASAFRKKFGARLRPITIGPGLVVYLDQVKRARFIQRWNNALRGE